MLKERSQTLQRSLFVTDLVLLALAWAGWVLQGHWRAPAATR